MRSAKSMRVSSCISMRNICRTLRRFALSLFSLDTLDISVKYEIYESKIFTNNTARYPPDMPFSIKKNGSMVVIVHADLEYSTWVRQKILVCFRNYIREVNRNHNREKKRESWRILLRLYFVFRRFSHDANAVRIDGRAPDRHVYLIKRYRASVLIEPRSIGYETYLELNYTTPVPIWIFIRACAR